MENVNPTNSVETIFDFDPTDQSVFDDATPVATSNQSNIFYKALPKLSKAEDKHYRSVIRILACPKDPHDAKAIVSRTTYNLTDEFGTFFADSVISNGDRTCPIFQAWRKLHYPDTNPLRIHTVQGPENWFDRQEKKHVLIQVIKDDNQPELVGKFLIWKIPAAVEKKLIAKTIKPSEPKKYLPLFDYLIGYPLELDVEPASAGSAEWQISYDSCEFGDEIQPILKTDGTSLFDSSELSLIDDYAEAKFALCKQKSPESVEKARNKLANLKESILPILSKAFNYVSAEAPDLIKEGGRREWSAEKADRVAKWVAKVEAGIDPKTPSAANVSASPKVPTAPAQPEQTQPATASTAPDDDLPF